jgi:adenylylsulfate kinase
MCCREPSLPCVSHVLLTMNDTIKSQNIKWHPGQITTDEREAVLGQRGCVIWLTGLSGSGKSTIACALEKRLIEQGCLGYVLDGDNVRHGLNKDLGFSAEDRTENIRRISEVAALFAQAGVIAITAFISPYRDGRKQARQAAGPGRFIEVFVNTGLQECEKRDPKGLYKKARAGQLDNMTGIDAPYEPPESPELELHTEQLDLDECVQRMVACLQDHKIIKTEGSAKK